MTAKRKKGKWVFENCKSYGRFGITIFKGSTSITEYGGKEKNAQNRQYIRIPNRHFNELVKFFLKYIGKSRPKREVV